MTGNWPLQKLLLSARTALGWHFDWRSSLNSYLLTLLAHHRSSFLIAFKRTRPSTHTLTHMYASHTSSLDVLRPCEWIFPFWPHVSNRARNNTITLCLSQTMPLCRSAISLIPPCKVPIVFSTETLSGSSVLHDRLINKLNYIQASLPDDSNQRAEACNI